MVLLLVAAPAPGAAAQLPLSLEEALRMAVERAPMLDARRARVEAARQESRRAGALPDPTLTLGIDNLPVTGPDAFNGHAVNPGPLAATGADHGLTVFGVLFAINSSLHSYLIVSYAAEDGVSLDVGFYYMADAMGRLLGTVLSGWVFQRFGLAACLMVSGGLIATAALASITLPRHERRGVFPRTILFRRAACSPNHRLGLPLRRPLSRC
ncbi:hypothetical protein [Dyella sp.]|uniref:hypothetical protein n=1 Tax=Dyella sp. TaxID=1869338 RepID=UPI002D765FAE|nr:hypothetical protein [Dyella sp.]HET7330210.1 hypothetical protein [Dyella sp.]